MNDRFTSIPKIEPSLLLTNDSYIALSSPLPLKTLSSAVIGSGVGSYTSFVNKHVNKNYYSDHPTEDLMQFLLEHQYDPKDTVGMMTAVQMEHVSKQYFSYKSFSLFIVVTAGVTNSVDATKRPSPSLIEYPLNTINTWIFINGQLSDEARVQAMVTATEAKTKLLHELKIYDKQSKTIATGTSTDSILIASTEQGNFFPYAGTSTLIGKAIGYGVYKVTKKAIMNSKKYNGL